MAKRHGKRSSKGPDPINALIDLAGAVALGAYVNHEVKKDYENGNGEASAKAAATVFGSGSLARGSRGIINLGGFIGLNSALKDIEKKNDLKNVHNSCFSPKDINNCNRSSSFPVRKNLWRDYCEDGSKYGLNPNDFESPDDYEDALNLKKSEACKTIDGTSITIPHDHTIKSLATSKDIKGSWRKYCSDGSSVGLNPYDFETADDYEEALKKAVESDKD